MKHPERLWQQIAPPSPQLLHNYFTDNDQIMRQVSARGLRRLGGADSQGSPVQTDRQGLLCRASLQSLFILAP